MKNAWWRVVLPVAFLGALLAIRCREDRLDQVDRAAHRRFEPSELDRRPPAVPPPAPGAYRDPFDDPGPGDEPNKNAAPSR